METNLAIAKIEKAPEDVFSRKDKRKMKTMLFEAQDEVRVTSTIELIAVSAGLKVFKTLISGLDYIIKTELKLRKDLRKIN